MAVSADEGPALREDSLAIAKSVDGAETAFRTGESSVSSCTLRSCCRGGGPRCGAVREGLSPVILAAVWASNPLSRLRDVGLVLLPDR